MIALGVNSAYHESSAALVRDGRVIAAVEEERFNRRKHGKPARVDNAHQLPVEAIQYCLATAAVRSRDLDVIAYSFDPSLRASTFVCDSLSNVGDWGDPEGERRFLASLKQVPFELSAILQEDARDRVVWIPHHMAHAASAYYPSGFDDAAILVADGIAEFATTLLAAGEGAVINSLEAMYCPNSIGFLWEKISQFLGFSEYDACKVMGLAAYGTSSSLRQAFAEFVSVDAKEFSIDAAVLEFRRERFEGLEKRLGRRRRAGEPLEARHADIAATLQAVTDEIMLALLDRLYARVPSQHLCLAGGVALNCSTNWRIKEEGPFETLFIPAAAHDAGTAVGAALIVDSAAAHASTATQTPFLGPEFSVAEIERAIRRHGCTARRVDDAAQTGACLLARGLIVGWFQGRLEFGPRALGNRSLMADPRRADSRARMNRSVKRREAFRPFAPSVLGERCDEWFEVGRRSASYGYMLFACPVKPGKAEQIPAVVHEDGTARIQIVAAVTNPKYHALISGFERLTGVPLVLNTSFNDSEPIVCSPEDALRTFLNTQIDALILDDYLIEKPLRETRWRES
jgi:carbamoyltransferase